MQVLHGGDAARDHLERRDRACRAQIDVAQRQPAREPELERMVGRAELERRQADMMMGVDEARRHDQAGAARNRRAG